MSQQELNFLARVMGLAVIPSYGQAWLDHVRTTHPSSTLTLRDIDGPLTSCDLWGVGGGGGGGGGGVFKSYTVGYSTVDAMF